MEKSAAMGNLAVAPASCRLSRRHLESVSQLQALKESGISHHSSRGATTQESPARQCRETQWNGPESRQGRHRVAPQSHLALGGGGNGGARRQPPGRRRLPQNSRRERNGITITASNGTGFPARSAGKNFHRAKAFVANGSSRSSGLFNTRMSPTCPSE
jgi:hypothetical protein